MGDNALTCFLGCCSQLLQVLMEVCVETCSHTSRQLSVSQISDISVPVWHEDLTFERSRTFPAKPHLFRNIPNIRSHQL